MSTRIHPFTYALLAVLVFSAEAHATQPAEPVPSDPESALLRPFESTHAGVSQLVESLARNVDGFFGNERAFEEANDSWLQVRLDAIQQSHGGLELDNQIRAKWVLPGTKNRLRLLVDTRLDNLGLGGERIANPPPNPSSKESSTEVIGLEAEEKAGEWLILPSLGAKARWTPDPYARLRVLRYVPLGDWLARPSLTGYWLDSEGASLEGKVDFDRPFANHALFRASTTLLYTDASNVSSGTQTFTVFQTLSPKATLAYDVGILGDDLSGWRTNQYYAQVRYRRLVHKNWAYLEVQPQYAWSRNDNFKGEASLRVGLELNFGRPYAVK